MRIRPAQPDDANAIAQVHVQAWKETYTGIFPDSVLARLNIEERAKAWRERIPNFTASRQSLVLVEDADGVFGFAGCGPARRGDLGTDGEIYMINIVNRGKRRRAGAKLMRAMADELVAWTFTAAGLWVLEENKPALAFYRRLGGTQGIAIEDDYDGKKLKDFAILWPTVAVLRDRADALSASPA